jgi:hypothetical protein
MPTDTSTLFTPGALAKALDLPDTQVKRAIKLLQLEPAARQGCRTFYTQADLDRLRATLA